MRHGNKRAKLSMMRSHRKATLRNMAKSLLKYQKIELTLSRAKEARRLVEKLITLSKTDTVASRRIAFSILTDRDLVMKLFKEIAPLFKTRTSGYTRIIPLGFRRGDGATMVILELTEKKIVEKLPKKKKAKPKAEEAPEEAKTKPAEEASAEKKSEEHLPKGKPISKAKPTLDDEKRTEKAKTEDKRMVGQKGFMKNLRGLFRKRGDR